MATDYFPLQSGPTLEILLVEDDANDAALIKKSLKDKKIPHAFTTAAGLAEAKGALSKEDFHIILTDHTFPDGTGMDLIEHVIEQKRHIPIIMITGIGDEDTAVGAMKAGAIDYLPKEGDFYKRIPKAIMQAMDKYNLATNLQEAYDKLDRQNAELKEMNAELTKLDELKSNFLSMVSHELRTPLSSIKGFTTNMLDGIDGDISEMQRQSLTRILGNTERLQHLINSLLDLSVIESGNINLKRVEYDLLHQIKRTVILMRPLIDEKGLHVEIKADTDLPKIWVDYDRINQVLTNLLGNAIKFTPRNGRISIFCDRQSGRDDYLRLTIRDTGIGIPEESVEVIFDKFSQVDNSSTRNYGGTGLGLAISKHIVGLHKGTIAAGNHKGGAEFTITLPVDVRKKQGAEKMMGSVLVVDDEPAICEMVKTIVETLPSGTMNIHSASTVQEAKTLLREHPIDVVFSDIKIPGESGFVLVRHIRQLYHGVRIVLMTSYIEEYKQKEAILAGADGYVSKPFTPDTIHSLLEKLTTKQRKTFGAVALEYQYITEQELQEALNEQFESDLAGKPHEFIGEILLRKNAISESAYNKVLEICCGD